MEANEDSAVMIIPAIMPENLAQLDRAAGLAARFAPCVQIDVMDGVFVPSTSWPYGDGQYAALEQLCADDARLPHTDGISYEAHLMVADPAGIGEALARLGVMRIIVHAEAIPPEHAADLFGRIRAAGASEIGIALLIDTPLEGLEPYAAAIDVVQLMGIEKVGFQGQAFDARALARVHEAHARFLSIPVAVDGGVNMQTIADLARAGASRFVVGSAIGTVVDPKAAYQSLLQAGVDNAVGDGRESR